MSAWKNCLVCLPASLPYMSGDKREKVNEVRYYHNWSKSLDYKWQDCKQRRSQTVSSIGFPGSYLLSKRHYYVSQGSCARVIYLSGISFQCRKLISREIYWWDINVRSRRRRNFKFHSFGGVCRKPLFSSAARGSRHERGEPRVPISFTFAFFLQKEAFQKKKKEKVRNKDPWNAWVKPPSISTPSSPHPLPFFPCFSLLPLPRYAYVAL